MIKLLILIIFFLTNCIYPQWIQQTNNLSEWEVGLAIDAYDSSNAVFYGTVLNSNNLYITKDGGSTWEPKAVLEPTVIDIAMIDQDTILLAMSDGNIYRTSNGGENWQSVWYNPELTSFINYIEFFPDSVLVAMGDGIEEVNHPIILYSFDKGKKWTQVQVSNPIGSTSGDTWRRIDFVSPCIGYFRSTGALNGLFKTTDMAVTWNMLNDGSNFLLIKFYNENIGLAAQTNKVLLTTDGGVTWHFSENEFTGWPNDFEFVPGNPNLVWLTNYEGLYFSNDMGITWIEHKLLEAKLKGRDIVFTDDKNGWLLCDDGKLYYTNNNGGLVVGVSKEIDNKIIEVYNLEQNFPNPFNPSTVISYQIPVFSHVRLTIYDLLGKEVETLVHEEQHAGNYKVDFNKHSTIHKRQLTSGIYFAQLRAGSFSKTIKLMLMK